MEAREDKNQEFPEQNLSSKNEETTEQVKVKKNKLFIFLIASTALVLIITLVLFYKSFYQKNAQNKNSKISSLSEESKKQAFSAKSVQLEESSVIAFIRKGDVWIGSLDGLSQEKITSHTPIQYTYRHYLSGDYIDNEWDEEFHIQPRLSGDGRYLAYLEISQDAIENLEKWKEDVEKEPLEVKNSGESIAFNPPGLSYDFKIYNLSNKTEIDLKDILHDSSAEINSYNLFYWAKEKNILPFDLNYSIRFLIEDQTGNFNIKSLEKDFFAENPINLEWHNGEWDTPSGPNISPDGNALIAYYQFTTPPSSCFNTWGYKSYLIDLNAKELIEIPLDKTLTCQSENIGWINNNQFYVLEHRPNYDFEFSIWSVNNLARQRVLGYKGIASHASVSPNNKWLTYLIKDPETDVSQYVFLNLETQLGVDLLGVMQKEGRQLAYDAIFTPSWNRNSQIAYLKMTKEFNGLSDLIMFNPETQEYSVALEDISELDINN